MNIATLTIEMAANVARLQQDLQAARGSVDSTFASIGSSVAKLKALVGTVFAGIAVGELLGAVEKVKTAAVDIERIAAASGASLDEFQRAAAGAKTVGVNLEKFGDIMKDTQDKLGDFLLTGGGELKDFFETIGPKVGVTAESFRNLSGPQALQLFYTSLEKAGVGQKVMIQQMESIANDASMLAPLLANGGAEFKSLGEEAAKAGALMSSDLIYASKALGEEMMRMDTVVGGITNSIMAELIPAITEMAAASREELSAGFEAVSAWVNDNKEQLLGAWELTKSIGAEVWSIVKVAIELAVGIGKWAVESGFLEASLITIGLLVAGFKDGVDIVGAAFAKLGSIILNAVAKPMSGFLNDVGVVLKWAGQGDLAGVFLDAAEGIKTAGEAGAQYAAGVADKFAAGDTAVARFTAGLGASTQAAQTAAKSTYTAYQALGTGAGISAKATEEAKKSADKAAAAAQKLAEEGVKLAASLLAQDSGLSGDFAAKWGKLNAAYKAGAVSLADLTQAQKLLLAEQPAMKAAADAQTKALEEQAQAWADVRSAMLAYRHAQEQAAQSVADGNQALRDEIELIGLSSKEQARVLQQRSQAIILTKQATLAEMERQAAITGTMTREQIALAAEIEGLQERNELLGAQEARESWTGFWESVNSTAHDTFVDVANNGMSAFKRIGQTLKSAVLDMLYQMTIKKWIVSIGASVAGGAGGVAQAAGSVAGGGDGGSGLGILSNASALYSAGSGLYAGFASAASEAALGAAFVGPSATAAGGAVGIGANIGAALQAIPGWGWALAGVALLAGSGLGKTLGANHGGGIYSSAGLSDQDAAQSIAGNLGWADPVTDFTTRGNAALSGQVKTAVGSLLEMYAGLGALAKGTVADLEVVAGFAANSKHNDEDVYGYFKIFDKLTGDLLSAYSNREMGKDGDAAWAQYVADLGSAMVSQLLEADIPSWMATVLNELGEAPTMDALTGAVAKIHTIDAAFGAFSATIDGFAGLTDKAREALMQAFGGIEGLSTSMTAYYEAYYSEAERAAKSTEALRLEFAKAGKELPATKEAYRAMVESALDGGEATAGFAAALIRLAPAFDSAKSAMTSLQAETKNLQIELMRASGDIAGAAAAQRALDTSGFDSATLAAYDLNESLREQVKAAEDAKAAREKAAAEEQNLQRTLKTLLGDTVWLREQELSTLNASNRGLQERIWALEDAKAAEAAARNDIEAAFSMLEKSVAAEKKAISDRLAAQEAGHQAQIDAAQEASSAIQSIASALANAAKNVRIETDRFDWRRLLAARSTISSATTAADLSQVVGLEDALGVAGQDSKKFYGRFEDYAFDQGVMAGNINLLDEKARLQLSTSDQMLLTLKDQLNAAKEAANAEMAALDAQLEEQRHLANVALGINDSVLSVEAAIAGLGTAINGLAAAQAQVAIAQAQASAAASMGGGGGDAGGGDWAGGGGSSAAPGRDYTDDELRSMGFDPADIRRGFAHAAQGGSASARDGIDRYIRDIVSDGTRALESKLGREAYRAAGITDLQRIAASEAWTNSDDGNGISPQELQQILAITKPNHQLYSTSSSITDFDRNRDYSQSEISSALATVVGQGASVADIISSGAKAYGLSEQQIRDAAKASGIPGFSQGINVVPHDMLAQIHEGEAVVPAQFNPFNPRAANSNNDELVAELRALRAEVADLKASNNAIAGHTAATHRQLVRIAPNDRVQAEVAA